MGQKSGKSCIFGSLRGAFFVDNIFTFFCQCYCMSMSPIKDRCVSAGCGAFLPISQERYERDGNYCSLHSSGAANIVLTLPQRTLRKYFNGAEWVYVCLNCGGDAPVLYPNSGKYPLVCFGCADLNETDIHQPTLDGRTDGAKLNT